MFEQYLKHAKIPVLQYGLKKEEGDTYTFSYKWRVDVKNFSMPFFVSFGSKEVKQITATGEWQKMILILPKEKDFKIRDDLGYFNVTRYFNTDKTTH